MSSLTHKLVTKQDVHIETIDALVMTQEMGASITIDGERVPVVRSITNPLVLYLQPKNGPQVEFNLNSAFQGAVAAWLTHCEQDGSQSDNGVATD